MSDEVDRLLAEADMSESEALRRALTQLQSDATSVRPIPSAELSELLVRRREPSRLRKHRGTLTALIVIGAVGTGVTAAAASPEVRAGAAQVFQIVTGAKPVVTNPAKDPSPSATTNPVTVVPDPDRSSPPGTPTSHPTTGVGNGAPKPTPQVSHRPQAPNSHAATPSPGHGQEHRP